MNAIRRDETLDFYHSLYVDQWDWERVMTNEERKYSYLKRIVKKVYKAIYLLQKEVTQKYPQLNNDLPKEISFISTKELEKRYPDLSRKEREDQICREEKAVFIYQIGWPLKDKMPQMSICALINLTESSIHKLFLSALLYENKVNIRLPLKQCVIINYDENKYTCGEVICYIRTLFKEMFEKYNIDINIE